jgi:hypothetical protein
MNIRIKLTKPTVRQSLKTTGLVYYKDGMPTYVAEIEVQKTSKSNWKPVEVVGDS